MKKLVHRTIGMLLVLVMVLAQILIPMPLSANAASTTSQSMQDGVTLHCWNWSYANIEANMAKIAEAGYTAVQTSPIQPIKESTVASWSTYGGTWWVYYQPTEFCIDTDTTNALGTKDQFKSMCATAEKYGIKVIVDVVANHLANNRGNDLSSTIPSYLRDNSAYWHDYTKNTSNYNDRYDITQHCMDGLPDLNTSNKDIQNYVLKFLKECVDAGADGFRFDAAKHIETPEDTYCASDFWPTVINGIKAYDPDVYIYGELLDSTGGVAMSAYTKYMSITDNQWSNKVREDVINSGNAGSFYSGYDKGVDANKLVLWAESHDTYANDNGASKYDSVTNINKTWALVAARADAMSLYLARPENLSQKLGTASVTGWAWDEVAAVNKFHTEFIGQGEYISNSNGYAMVERGTSGAVVVNVGSSGNVNIPVYKMANGSYVDQISGNTFTVSNGRLTGNITHQCGYAVLYNACDHSWVAGTTTNATCTTDGVKNYSCSKCGDTKTEVIEVAPGHNYINEICSVCGAEKPKDYTLYYDNSSTNWSSVYIYYWSDEDTVMTAWPGQSMKSEGDDIYSYTVPLDAQYVIFNDGSGDDSKKTADLDIPGDSYLYADSQWKSYVICDHPSHDQSGICTSCGQATAHNYVSGTCTICGVTKPADKTIYFDNSNNWSTVYIYFWNDGDITYTEWPGEVMTKVDGSIYSYTVPGDTTKVIFHNNKGGDTPDSNKTADLTIDGDLYTMSTGKWTEYNTCDHSYTSAVTKEATCDAAGVKTYTCSKCSATYTESIPALGHSYVGGKCTVCGAEESKNTMTIFFQNNWLWSDVKLYYWGSSIGSNPDWSGISMELYGNDGNYDIYALEIPTDITGIVINGIKDDGTGNLDKTPDIKSGWYDGICYYMTWNDGNEVGHEDIDVILPCEHSYSSTITKEATCTDAGVKTYTCSKCGDSYTESVPSLGHTEETVAGKDATCTETGLTAGSKCSVCGEVLVAQTEIPSLGHKYENGSCTVCGAADPNYNPIVQPSFTVLSKTLNLEGEVKYNMIFMASNTSSVKNMGLITFLSNPSDVSIDSADYVIPGAVSASGMYMVGSQGIPAKNLGDTLYMVIYAELTDGSYAYGDVVPYSATDYAYGLLGNSSISDNQRKLLVAMLNYGAEAQLAFGYNTDNLINADLATMEIPEMVTYSNDLLDGCVSADDAKTGNFPTGGFYMNSATVSLEGALAINYLLMPANTPANGMKVYYWTAETYNSVDALTVENADGTLDSIVSSGMYMATYNGLAASQMGDTVYVAAVYENGGNTYTTGVISYSLAKYLTATADGTGDQKNLAKATVVYGYYADIYFANI